MGFKECLRSRLQAPVPWQNCSQMEALRALRFKLQQRFSTYLNRILKQNFEEFRIWFHDVPWGKGPQMPTVFNSTTPDQPDWRVERPEMCLKLRQFIRVKYLHKLGIFVTFKQVRSARWDSDSFGPESQEVLNGVGVVVLSTSPTWGPNHQAEPDNKGRAME